MEEPNIGVQAGNGNTNYLWWAAASSVQLSWAIYSVRRGYTGDGRFLPLKAFGVGSLFVGASATAAIGTLSAYGIHSVKDVMETCASLRAKLERLGASPRAGDK